MTPIRSLIWVSVGGLHRLMNNDRRKAELLHAILFSLPGSPVLYYGDEIGMGDNVYLGDRFGVRTPMQWNMNLNAGFSTANPQRLYLPIITDPAYRHESVNVAAQEENPFFIFMVDEERSRYAQTT